MNQAFIILLLFILLKSLHGQKCRFDYSMVESKEKEYHLFLLKLNETEIPPEELILQNDFDLIHFKSTIDLAKEVFNEEIAKLSNRIQENTQSSAFEIQENGEIALKTECSVNCGFGERLVAHVICEDPFTQNCSHPKIKFEKELCQANFECPKVKYGEWTPWSKCSSETCFSSVEALPKQGRVRSCQPDCSGIGTVEYRPCDVSPCPPSCPDFTATMDRDISNDLKVSILLTIKTPDVSIGKEQRLEVIIKNFYTNEVVDAFNASLSRTVQRTNLDLNSAYIPEIKVIQEVRQPRRPSSSYQSLSVLVHHCQGRVLHTDFFVCDDGSRILAEQVCNNQFDCLDSSDERSEICQGKFGIPLVIFTLLLTLYIILGVIVFLNQNKDELHAKESPKLSKDELRELQKEYVALHEASNTKDFLEKYKECRQVLLEVVNVVELVVHGHVVYEALECLKNAHVAAGGNMIVYGSLSGRLRAKVPFTLQKIARAIKYILQSVNFYIDIYKDVAFIFVLYHLSSNILHFRFGNDLRLDILAVYILCLIIGSQATLHLYSFVRRRKYSDRWLALFFPIHNAFNKYELWAELELIETFMERIPQLIVILCLWRESEKNSRLGLLLFSIFDGSLGLPAKSLFVLSLLTTYSGVLRSSVAFYNRKGFPLLPSLKGKVLQYFFFSSLLIPKTLVASTMIFSHYPYFYPAAMLLEMFLIGIVVYKLPLRFTKMEPCNIGIISATVVVPSFYRSSKLCLLQNLFLFFLTWAIVYLPCYYFFQVYLEVDPFLQVSAKGFISESIFIYGLGAVSYVIFGGLFYCYGHNWGKLIRTHCLNSLHLAKKPHRLIKSS